MDCTIKRVAFIDAMNSDHHKVIVNDNWEKYVRLDNVVANAYALGAARLNLRPRPFCKDAKSV
jgi:hypothetical protein